MQDLDVYLGSGREKDKNNAHGREPRFTLSQHRSIGDLFQFVVKITKLSTSANNFMSTVHSVRNILVTHQVMDEPHVTVVPEFDSISIYILFEPTLHPVRSQSPGSQLPHLATSI